MLLKKENRKISHILSRREIEKVDVLYMQVYLNKEHVLKLHYFTQLLIYRETLCLLCWKGGGVHLITLNKLVV